jgi:hypothetical protein
MGAPRKGSVFLDCLIVGNSGVYLCRITAPGVSEARRMVLLK